jgi:hypothetical protein
MSHIVKEQCPTACDRFKVAILVFLTTQIIAYVFMEIYGTKSFFKLKPAWKGLILLFELLNGQYNRCLSRDSHFICPEFNMEN